MKKEENTKKMILITGATGTVGSEVIKQLVSTGAQVRAGVHSLDRTEKIITTGVEIVELDYNKPETIEPAFQGIDKVFLLVAPYLDNSVEITGNLVAAAKNAGVNHIVEISVFGVGIDAASPAVKDRFSSMEKTVKDSGISYTILRPLSFMQNFINYYGQTIKEQNSIFMGTDEGKVSFIDVRDIAAVVVNTLTQDGHKGKVYELTGAEAITYAQTADILSSVLGRKITCVNVSDDDIRQGAKAQGMSDWMIEATIGGNKFIRGGHAEVINSTVKEITGKLPIKFKQFAEDYNDSWN